jgi:hypothetical protein
LKWLVLFFTRPIRLSDLSALAARLKPSPRPDTSSGAAGDEEQERPRPRRAAGDARPSVPSSLLRPELEVAVTEQPIDTLPAELQEELVRAPGRRPEGKLDA